MITVLEKSETVFLFLEKSSVNKPEARQIFLNQRQAISTDALVLMDQAILNHFSTLNLEGVGFLHLFLPIAEKKEVNTLTIANWIKAFHPEIKIVLCKSNLQHHTLSHFIWDENTVLQKNQWGITEPVGGIEVGASVLDMVLVPLLAFDELGHRVGYGKGFYDRFLAVCRPDVQKVGLSHFEPIAKITDANPLDIPLNACITPKKIWHFA